MAVHPSMTGRVALVRRYPVKSMQGEDLETVEVTDRGLLGDRAYALLDEQTGKIVSAKNPRVWPGVLDNRARFLSPPTSTAGMPAARIRFAEGQAVSTDEPDIDSRLSKRLGRPVKLLRAAVAGAVAEGYWPDHDWLPERDTVFEFPLPPGTFFDGASVHLLTTATLRRLRALLPTSEVAVERFRPNFVVETDDSDDGFVENAWIGRRIAIGNAILRVGGPCPRCVMTTLAQVDIPKDSDILRTAVRENAGNVGVYASVERGGTIRKGDAVSLAD